MSDKHKDRILFRRAKLIAAALASVAAGAECGGTIVGGSDASTDAGTDVIVDPKPCLAAKLDAGTDVKDTGPQPCLAPPLDE